MNNLVTGGTGFIGSFIAEELVKRGERVKALVRRTSNTKFLRSLGVELCYGDLSDAASISLAVKGADRVFHSAAMVGDWVPREDAYRINVDGTRFLLNASLGEKVKRFIFVSSLAVLGMRDHHKTPSDPPAPKTGDVYADSKIDAETLVTEFAKKNNLPFTVLRPGFVFGPRDDKVIPRMVEFLKKGKYMFVGSGRNKVNMIYVENFASAIVDAANSEKTLNQVYNITNESGMTMTDVVNMVSDLWGYERPDKHVPKNIAYTLCGILEFFARVTKAKEPPLLNKTRMKFLSLNLDFDISKIKRDLGYRPKIDMMEGLKRTKAWMEQEKISL
ncbi:MAG: NAD-dependent epimerase/dehydratase family protein [Candidatus Omnitrophota bacterium]